MTSHRWAEFWALVFGLSLGLLYCGVGHAADGLNVHPPGYCNPNRVTADVCIEERLDTKSAAVYLPAGVSPDDNVTMIRVDRDGYVITHDQVCVSELATVLQEREDVDALQLRVDRFYRQDSITVRDASSVVSVDAWGPNWRVTPEGYLQWHEPAYDPDLYHPPVKKTEEELYQERKAEILKQIEELDRERSRKKEAALRDVQYEKLKDQLEEAKGHLIVSWETAKRRCVR